MSCCSSPCTTKACPCHYVSWLPRIGFGLVLAGFGVAHYRDISNFTTNAGRVFTDGSVLSMVAMYLAYVVPALMIVGGVLFAVRQLPCVSKTCIVAVLSGILGWAGLGIMFMDPRSESAMALMQNLGVAVQNASILFILYVMIKKMSHCSQSCSSASSTSSCCK